MMNLSMLVYARCQFCDLGVAMNLSDLRYDPLFTIVQTFTK